MKKFQLNCITSISYLKNKNSSEKTLILINEKISDINKLVAEDGFEYIKLKYDIEDVLDDIDKEMNKQMVQYLISLLNIIENTINSKILSNKTNNVTYYNNFNSNNNFTSYKIPTQTISCNYSQTFSPNLGLNR
jgi:hypothetical protein